VKIASKSKIVNNGNNSNSDPDISLNDIADAEYRYLFDCIDKQNCGFIDLAELISMLNLVGIKEDDPRLNFNIDELKAPADVRIDYEKFKQIIKNSQGDLIKNAIQGNLIIPDFNNFSKEIKAIYESTKKNKQGNVATYIPQLARVNPEFYAVSICTIDGQRLSLGDNEERFCIQSVCKPINYCIILEEHGEEKVHQHIGREPSGIGFNGLVLNSKGLPHNPMINAGAIMSCSLIKPNLDMADRFDYVLDVWNKLSGNSRQIGFNNSVYLSERETADRNFALGYFMRENKAFPENTNLTNTLEFYFQCCSIQMNSDALAVTAATLANAGICPITKEQVLQPNTVKHCLSLMNSCGMYDFSGEFAFTIGLPAKSGVGGGLMLVIPNLMGIAIWSPRLDKLGNTVRGIDFCKELISKYNFHNYDSLTSTISNKKNPRLKRNQSKIDGVISLCWAASEGDLLEVQHLYARGIDINAADYDGRTALHLAASEGKTNVLEFLLRKGANLNPKDRWGSTPLDDAKKGKHQQAITLLEEYQANQNIK
jgi:glutaminase